jgi:hypothetical protein
VKFLLGFNAEDAASDNEILNNNGLVQQVLTAASLANSPTTTMAHTLPTVVHSGGLLSTTGSSALTSKILSSLNMNQDKVSQQPARVVVQIEPPTSGINHGTISGSAASSLASGGTASIVTMATGNGGQFSASDLKTEKTRKREPVDPSRCIYACESCGKAFTTKFNLKRHINMHCSRSREAGVPIQGPPSASQPSRKHKSGEGPEFMSVNVSPGSNPGGGGTQMKVRRVSSSSTASGSIPMTVTSTSSPSLPTLVKTVPVQVTSAGLVSGYAPVSLSKSYQEPMTVQLAVNAQGQLTSVPTSVHRTVTSVPVTQTQTVQMSMTKPSLPVQPLPESAVQIIQSLGGAVTVSGSNHLGGNMGSLGANNRIIRVINAPQIIATQSRAGITTGATVQLQAIPVSQGNSLSSGHYTTVPTSGTAGTTLTFPQQPLPLVQQIGTRQIVLTTANNGRITATTTAGQPTYTTTHAGNQHGTTHHIISNPGQLTTLDSNKINIIPVTSSASALPMASQSAADLIYRSIVSGSKICPTSPTSLTPLQAVVTSSTISSPTCGFNDGPPADLFDSEDGDALSVATTTETPTPPPSLNGDPILSLAPITAAIKSLPYLPDQNSGLNTATIATNSSGEKVVVIQQPQNHILNNGLGSPTGTVVQLNPAGVPQHILQQSDLLQSFESTNNFNNIALIPALSLASAAASAADTFEDEATKMTLPSNRFHGQLTSIPKGWLRKVVTTSKGFQKVFYYNPVGKRFSTQEEIDQYFARLGYSVPMSLFNFELPKLVDEDEDDDEDDPDGLDDLDEASTVNNKTMVVKVTSNAKGEATVTPMGNSGTIMALPSGTIVTRADTTVIDVSRTSQSYTAQSQPPTLVTSTKPLLTTSHMSHAKVMTIGHLTAAANSAASAQAAAAGTASTST